MGLVDVMHNSEAVSSRVSIFVGEDLIPNDIDISLDLRFLKE